MAKSIKVNIGGKEFSLRGDNEKLIYSVAREVNDQLELIGSKHGVESSATISTLVALNMAEKAFLEKTAKEEEEDFIIDELHKMISFIEEKLST